MGMGVWATLAVLGLCSGSLPGRTGFESFMGCQGLNPLGPVQNEQFTCYTASIAWLTVFIVFISL